MIPPLVCQFCRRKSSDEWYGVGNTARYCSIECVRCHIIATLLPSRYAMRGIANTLKRLDTPAGPMPPLTRKLPVEHKP